jgi:hypothetical protein
MTDSFYMGDDDMGDVIGDDDMGDVIGDEVGIRRKRIARAAKRHGMVTMSKGSFQQMQQKAAVQEAAETGIPQSLPNGRLALSRQRLEVVPLGAGTIAAAASSVLTLSVNVQRSVQPFRLVLQAADSTTGADFLFAVGVTNVTLGAHNLFGSPGIVAAATSFAANAWGTEILTVGVAQGGLIRVDLIKTTITANPLVAVGTIFGYAGQGQ